RAALDVLARVGGVGDAHAQLRRGDELHEPLRTRGRNRLVVAGALRLEHGLEQRHREAVLARVFAEQQVVAARGLGRARAAGRGGVAVVTKRGRWDTAPAWAQGGIASVVSSEDSYEAHIKDTLTAGAGLCHEDAVTTCVTEGPARVRELVDLGARFTKAHQSEDGGPPAQELDLHREGGHSARRIVHADDMTGREVMRALLVACEGDPNISF